MPEIYTKEYMEKLDKIAEKMYLCSMAEPSSENQNLELQGAKRTDIEKDASSARIKRMRGWLGVKSTSSLGGYDDNGGGVAYGDGHSGWNR
jgi:hypothetical protein